MTGRYHEDYPETYKAAEGDELCVETEQDQQAKAASSLVAIFEKRVAIRAARCKHPRDLKHVSVAQLDFEYDYVVNRLFGEKIGNFNGRRTASPAKLGVLEWFASSGFDEVWHLEDDCLVPDMQVVIRGV